MAVRKKSTKSTEAKKKEIKIEPVIERNAIVGENEAVKIDSAAKISVSSLPENNPVDSFKENATVGPAVKENIVNPVSENNLIGDPKENVVAESVVEGGAVNLSPENSPRNNPEEKAQEKPAVNTPINPAPENNPLNDFKEKVEIEMNMPNHPQKNYMWPILLIFIIALVLLGGVFAYKQGIFKVEKVNVVSLSPTPIASPVPTKAVDLKKYEIEILNGSEVSGEASRQKDNLEGEGFTISSIGNADNSDYTDTIIKAKKEVDKDFLAKLKNDLENTFTVGEAQVLSEDSSVPVVIILGVKK